MSDFKWTYSSINENSIMDNKVPRDMKASLWIRVAIYVFMHFHVCLTTVDIWKLERGGMNICEHSVSLSTHGATWSQNCTH
jgi:hypothetical protein